MPSTVEQLSPSRVKITIEVPFSELKPSIDKAYREVAKQINIPGFRKGKVPPMVIDQRVGRGTILQEAINASLPEFYGQAVQEHELNPLAQPEVEVTELVDNALTFSPPTAPVRLDASLSADGATITIVDSGLGVPNSELEQLNADLAHGSEATPETARRMGLFVVSRLAERHGIRVSLARNPEGGMTASVLLPPQVLPELPQPAAGPARPSAAELASGAAGLYLFLNQPYGIGDRVRIGDRSGVVQEVELFITRIEDDSTEYIVPNRAVFEEGASKRRS